MSSFVMTPQAARRAVGLLDLTSLGDADDAAVAVALCRRAVAPFGAAPRRAALNGEASGDETSGGENPGDQNPGDENARVAAVCLWPRFIGAARAALAGGGVKIAVVVDFPRGGGDPPAVAAAIRAAVADGADEIDVVAPYRRFLAGDAAFFSETLSAARVACGAGVKLKVILESGAFDDLKTLRAAADLALAAGADFLKTSTGRREPGATPAALDVFFDALRAAGDVGCTPGSRTLGSRTPGVKASGGVRTAEQAAAYLAQADRRMGAGWATPDTFRFGASALLDALIPFALASSDGGSCREPANGGNAAS